MGRKIYGAWGTLCAGRLLRGLGVAGMATMLLSGCMVGALYQGVLDNPVNMKYEFNRETLRVPKLDDAPQQPLEVSYVTYTFADGKREAHYAQAVTHIDFARGEQDLVLQMPPAKVPEPPKTSHEPCPRTVLEMTRVSRLTDLALVGYDDLQKKLAPCTTGYVAFTLYAPLKDQFPIVLFRVSEAGIVTRSDGYVPARIAYRDRDNMWANTGRYILMPAALAADLVLYSPWEWIYMTDKETTR